MSGERFITRDHDKIRRWVEEREGVPSVVSATHSDDETGILRLDFPGYGGDDALEEIDWDEWFDKFDLEGLALLYQETTAGGQQSNFNKLISRETADEAMENAEWVGAG